MNRKIVLWDKDSTLADTYHRQYLIPMIKDKKATWDQYAHACLLDRPIEGAVALYRLLDPYYHQIVVSGASASAEPLIREWAKMHDIPLRDMILRPKGDRRPNGDFKLAVVRKLIAAGEDVALFVEDWPEAGQKIGISGVPVLLVNPNYPADSPHDNMTVAL